MIESELKDIVNFITTEETNECNASSIGIAAFHKFSNGNLSPIIPLYLKKSSAELLLEDKNK